jgi:hypothetical protein
LVEKNNPSKFVPAKMREPFTASVVMEEKGVEGKPAISLDQLYPLLIDIYNPSLVPAKTLPPFAVKECTQILLRPLLTCVHRLPLLVDKKTPSKSVPAKILVPLKVNEVTPELDDNVSPFLISVHFVPLLVDK